MRNIDILCCVFDAQWIVYVTSCISIVIRYNSIAISKLAIRLQRRHGTWKYLNFKENTYLEHYIRLKRIWHTFMEYFSRCPLRKNFSTNIFSSYFGAYSVSDLPNGDCMWLLLGRRSS